MKRKVNPDIALGLVALLVGFAVLFWGHSLFSENPYKGLPKLFMPPSFRPPPTGVVGPLTTVFVGISAWEYRTAAGVVTQMPAASEILDVDIGLGTARIRVYGPMEERTRAQR
jgi:hypothetical protein